VAYPDASDNCSIVVSDGDRHAVAQGVANVPDETIADQAQAAAALTNAP
jgi:hypothetical protein